MVCGGGGSFGLGSMLLLLLGVTWFVSPPVAGLQCYECDQDSFCVSAYKEEKRITTCAEDDVGCGVIAFEDDKGEYSRLRRFCADKGDLIATYNPGAEERCGDGLSTDKDRKLKWCFCKGNLCNVVDGKSLGSGSSDGKGPGDGSSNGKGSGDGNSDTIKKYPSSVMIFVAAAVTIIAGISATKFGVLHGRL